MLGAVVVVASSPRPQREVSRSPLPHDVAFESSTQDSAPEQAKPSLRAAPLRAAPEVKAGVRGATGAGPAAEEPGGKLGANAIPESDRAVVTVRVENKKYLDSVVTARRQQ
jgi:hypothetical protein